MGTVHKFPRFGILEVEEDPSPRGVGGWINSLFVGSKLRIRSRQWLRKWVEYSVEDCGIDFVIIELDGALKRAKKAKGEGHGQDGDIA